MDKVQKIREEVERIQLYTQSEVLKQVLDYIDEVQKEPVSKDLEEEIGNYVKKNGYDGLDSIEEVKYIAQYFTKWQKLQDMGITNKAQDVVADVLSSADNPLDAYATEMAFMMLPATLKESYHQTNRDRIYDAVRLGAKWQREKDMKLATVMAFECIPVMASTEIGKSEYEIRTIITEEVLNKIMKTKLIKML